MKPLLILILLLFISTCKRNEDDPKDKEPIKVNQKLKSYTCFEKGSTWIYLSSTNKIDTTKLFEASEEIREPEPKYGLDFHHEVIKMRFQSYLHLQQKNVILNSSVAEFPYDEILSVGKYRTTNGTGDFYFFHIHFYTPFEGTYEYKI